MIVDDFRHRLDRIIWKKEEMGQPRVHAKTFRILRTVAVLVRDVMQGQLTLRAMGLVYTTLLTLVPLLALSFSVLKAFGVHNQIEPLLRGLLAPLGEDSSRELTGRMIGFIGNMNVGVLGSVGLALLLYTSVSLIQKIEESFNFIWHIDQPRNLGERFSRYLSLLLIGPILVFSTVGISASVMNTDIVDRILDIRPFGLLYVALSRLLPYLLVTGAFTFAYRFIPNTQVRFTAALFGGSIAGLAWQSAGAFFALFVVTSGNYTAVYSGFAVLILFLIWLYISWLILLIGADIAFYCQHPEYLVARSGEPQLASREQERLALGIMSVVTHRFLAGQAPPGIDELAGTLSKPSGAIRAMLGTLVCNGLITPVAGDLPAYLPSRDPGRITLSELLTVVRSEVDNDVSISTIHSANEIVEHIDEAIATAVSGLTLIDLINNHEGCPLCGPRREDHREWRMDDRLQRHAEGQRQAR